MWNDFQLKPGYFGHYVVNIWILHKFPGLVNFLWHCSIRGEGWHDLITARKEEKSSLPRLAAIDIQGREGIFSTSRLRWEAPSFTQLWRYHCRWKSGVFHWCFIHGLLQHQRVGVLVASLLLGSSQSPGVSSWASSDATQVGRKRETLLPTTCGDSGSYLSAPDRHTVTTRGVVEVTCLHLIALTLCMQEESEGLNLFLWVKIPAPSVHFRRHSMVLVRGRSFSCHIYLTWCSYCIKICSP